LAFSTQRYRQIPITHTHMFSYIPLHHPKQLRTFTMSSLLNVPTEGVLKLVPTASMKFNLFLPGKLIEIVYSKEGSTRTGLANPNDPTPTNTHEQRQSNQPVKLSHELTHSPPPYNIRSRTSNIQYIFNTNIRAYTYPQVSPPSITNQLVAYLIAFD
jgi:hypothetical protein